MRKGRFRYCIYFSETPTWCPLLEKAVLGVEVSVESLPVGPEGAVLLLATQSLARPAQHYT